MLLGLGLGLTMPLLPRVGLRVMAEEHSGQGSGIMSTSSRIGATLGTVLGGIAHMAAVKYHLDIVLAALPVADNKREAIVQAIGNGSNSEIEIALAALDTSTSQALKLALRNVQDDAFAAAMLVCVAFTLFGAGLVCYLMRAPIPPTGSAAELLRHRQA